MSEFFELYRRPEWQEKRLRVMEAAGFKCEECGSNSRTLNVHHRHYKKGAKPWEYVNEDLVCLCEKCHEDRHAKLTELKCFLGQLESCELDRAIGYVKCLLLVGFFLDSVAVRSTEEAQGVADCYGITDSPHGKATDRILDFRARDGTVNHRPLQELFDSVSQQQTSTH